MCDYAPALGTGLERNWSCLKCNSSNLARRIRCHRCKAQRPADGGGYVQNNLSTCDINNSGNSSGTTHGASNEVVEWVEVMDPNTQQIYYHNTNTGATTWERPAELGQGQTYYDTGWFGRGSNHKYAKPASEYEERNERWLKRPAPQQQEFIHKSKYTLEGSNEYNIWYDRYIGHQSGGFTSKEAAVTRCELEFDAGKTKADMLNAVNKYFCLHFARGACSLGAECNWYHRTPVYSDYTVRNDTVKDIFGRELHMNHRDDMGGIGCINSPSRTLYVGGLLTRKYESVEALEKRLWEQFGEWGEVESINLITRLSVAFVRYRNRSNCEFAREAMTNQSLGQHEVLNIRWAHDDPNPVAKERANDADVNAALAVLGSKGVQPVPTVEELLERDEIPAAKRQKTFAESHSSTGVVSQDLNLPAEEIAGAQGFSSTHPWQQVYDPSTGALYYVNVDTNETSWHLPVDIFTTVAAPDVVTKEIANTSSVGSWGASATESGGIAAVSESAQSE